MVPLCPIHQTPAELRDDACIYGRSYGQVYICMADGCDYRVGTHRGTDKPKGTMANAPMREARKKAHHAFDGWWRREGINRREAYRILKDRTGTAHIAEASVDECVVIIEAFKRS